MRCRANSDCVGFPLPPATLLAAPRATPAATAAGAIAVQLNSFLLDMSAMSNLSFMRLLGRLFPAQGSRFAPAYGTKLRNQDVVSLKRNLPQGHHGVIFMDHVVTVSGVLAQPVAEAEEQLDALVGMQLSHVLAPQVGRHGRRHPVAAQHL